MLPYITIAFKKHNGQDRMMLYFDYDVDLINHCKRLKARWNNSERAWHLPDDHSTILNLETQFKYVARLIWPEANQTKHLQEKAHEALSKKGLSAQQNNAVINLIRHLKVNGRSDSTISSYEYFARMFFRYTEKNPEDLSHHDIIEFQTEHLIKNNYAASSQRQFASTIRLLCESNDLPMIKTEKVPSPRRDKALPKVLSRTEVMSLLSCCNNLKHRTMLSLLYSSGLRVGELLDLRLKDINMEGRSIHVKRAKGRKDRVIGFGINMETMLHNYIVQYRPIEYLFNGNGKLKYSSTSVRSVIKAAAKKARLNKDITPHMFRHSYATHMIEDGVNLRYVQELLGHTRPETTQIYTHVASDHLMKLKNPFDSLMDQFQHQLPKDQNLTNQPSLFRKLKDDENL